MRDLTILTTSPLFRGIDEADLPGLLTCVEAGEKTYRRGEILLRCGEKTERLGLVLPDTTLFDTDKD